MNTLETGYTLGYLDGRQSNLNDPHIPWLPFEAAVTMAVSVLGGRIVLPAREVYNRMIKFLERA